MIYLYNLKNYKIDLYLPPFSKNEAKEIIKKNLGKKIFDSIINFSEPIAAAL